MNKSKKTVVLTIRVEPELKHQLQEIADREFRPLVLQVRKVLEEYVKMSNQ